MLDKGAIDTQGIAGYTLMNAAGTAVFQHYCRRWPLTRRILVLAGPGNNGGDGYVVAHLARKAGQRVTVIGFGGPQPGGDADRCRQAWVESGGEIVAPDALQWPENPQREFDLVIDALLGTGLSREPVEPMAGWIRAVNQSGLPVVAVDLPSGLNNDNGTVPGVAISAQMTVTFIGRKRGLYTGQGPNHCGTIEFAGLSVDHAVYAAVPASARLLLATNSESPLFPPRRRTGHKGNFGHLLVIGGGRGMAGAAIIAGSAALRAGCGLVSVAVHRENAAAVVSARPEMMVHGIENATEIAPLLERADAVAIGPGLGLEPWARDLWQASSDYNGPMVVDADALNLLAEAPWQRHNWVLTPHPGEAARLLGSGLKSINDDRFAAVEALQKKYSGTVLLKGAGTLIQGNEGLPTLLRGGNPGMASGGMGDALTGITGAFMAQGLDLETATHYAAAAHGWAGDRAASERGEQGLLAGDLIDRLGDIINGSKRQWNGDKHAPLQTVSGG